MTEQASNPGVYTVHRLEYGRNGTAVAYSIGETWDDATPTADDGVDNYTITYAKTFRYDGGRQRYLVREFDVADLNLSTPVWTEVSEVFTDYDGNRPYGDFTAEGDPYDPLMPPSTTISEKRSYELGVATVDPHATSSDANTDYYHTDQIGTTRTMSDTNSAFGNDVVYTAFGQLIFGTDPRYGYAGAWGYQSHMDFPFQHVGARYYDPATGRFLQRDPIGIAGGTNVYAYVYNSPAYFVDPFGLDAVANRPMQLTPPSPTPTPPSSAQSGPPYPDLTPPNLPWWAEWSIYGYKMACNLGWWFSIGGSEDTWHSPVHGGRGIGCFEAGTVIATPEGGVPIEGLAVGSFVVSSDPNTCSSAALTVSNVTTHWARELVTLETAVDHILTTAEHPFWVSGRGWVPAGLLRPGDPLLTADGETIPVLGVSVKRLSQPVRVYNITVTGDHMYHVGPSRLLVHNKNV